MGSWSFYANFRATESGSVWAGLRVNLLGALLLLVAGMLLFTGKAWAATYVSLADLQQQVRTYLETQYRKQNPVRLEVQVSNLDPRLQLAECSQALSFRHNDGNNSGGNVSVHTRCEGEQPWAIYIPAQINLYRALPVASRQLERGSLLTRADITTKVINLSLLRQGAITDVESLIGMEIKRPMEEGEAFRSANVEAPLMVRRGENVSIETQAGPIMVTTSGTALANGRQGDRIRVRNTQSDRVVTAEVVATGRVKTAI